MLGTLAWAAGLLALATAAHYAFWTLWLRVPGTEDEVVLATTADGWRLALGRRRPRGPPRPFPVVLVHGLAVNRQFMDFGLARHSLSAALAAEGFDCFAVDLRGHGGSRRGPSRDWCFDDYVRKDLPAAVEAACAAAGARQALVVGHSQGALVALAAAGLDPGRIAGIVAIAGPVRLVHRPELLRFARLTLAAARVNRVAARMLAPIVGLIHSRLAQVAVNTRNAPRPVLRRMVSNAMEDIAPGVVRQYGDWMRNDRFASADGAVDYRAGLPRTAVPALFVAGAKDGLAPPAVVREAFEAWGGPRAWICAEAASGFSADYGHADLIFGTRAPEELFPPLRAWLLSRAGEAAAPAVGLRPA